MITMKTLKLIQRTTITMCLYRFRNHSRLSIQLSKFDTLNHTPLQHRSCTITTITNGIFFNILFCFLAFHGSIVFIVIVIGIAHILIVHAEVEARIIVEDSFGSAFFVLSAVIAMTFVYWSVGLHGSILCAIG